MDLPWEVPYGLMIAGATAVVIGIVGAVLGRKRADQEESDLAAKQAQTPRPQMPPIPDLLDSRGSPPIGEPTPDRPPE